MKKILCALVLASSMSSLNGCGDIPETTEELIPPSEIKNPFVSLAECLVSQKVNAHIYGATWCPPCKYQESLFTKEAWEILKPNDIICSETHGDEVKKECLDEKITAYPTWKFETYNQPVIGVILVYYNASTGKYFNEFEKYTPCIME